MKKQFLMVREADSLIHGTSWEEDPDDGPVLPQGAHEPGVVLIKYEAEFSRAGRLNSEVAYWRDGAIVWEDAVPVEQHRLEAIDAIDAAGEELRLAVISKMTQTEEYKLAEQHAREYRAAGYTGQAGRGVTGWTRAKHRDGWTDRDSADDILATADRWYGLLFDIRDARLAAKEDVRHATTAGEIAAIRAGMEASMQALALQMNTTTTD